METKKITLEKLAEKLGKTVWSKGDFKRIYLNDEGYNTKKMSTKTFIFEKDGEFIVSCRIDCPSQPYQWIELQQDEIKEKINEKIKFIISDKLYVIFDKESDTYIDSIREQRELSDLYDSDKYLTENGAQIFIDEDLDGNSKFVIKEIDND